MKTFEEFCDYYHKYGKCPNQFSKPLHILNNKELQSKFKSYQKANSKIKLKKGTVGDPLWDEVSQIVHLRDKEQCRFLSKLKIDNYEAYKYIINDLYLIKTLDLAHVIPRSKSSSLYYEPDNIVLLSRCIHSSLDTFHDPISGKAIAKDQVDEWWKYIVGDELWKKLNGLIARTN